MRSTSPHLTRAVLALLLPGLLAFLALHVASPGRADAAPTSPRAAAPGALAAPAHARPHQRQPAIRGWRVAPSRVRAGAPFVAHLKVVGGQRPIRLQRKIHGTWRTVAAARSTRTGRVALRWGTPRTATRVALRVRAPRAGARPAVLTRVRIIHVRRAGTTPPAGLSAQLTRMLELVNEARASGYTCGDTWYRPVPPLAHNDKLGAAASKFARLMASRDFFSHNSPDGSSAGDRIEAEGYDWRSYGENIAAGYTNVGDVVQGWLDSPGHCQNLMGGFKEIGLGYAYDASSTYDHYWVQDFGTR